MFSSAKLRHPLHICSCYTFTINTHKIRKHLGACKIASKANTKDIEKFKFKRIILRNGRFLCINRNKAKKAKKMNCKPTPPPLQDTYVDS